MTIVTSDWLVPNNWRSTLEPRLVKLSIPELDEAFAAVKTILKGRSEAEVQSLAADLVQSITPGRAKKTKGVPLVFELEPRMISQLYSNSLTSAHQQAQTLVESLAIGTLISLNRACRAMDQAKNIGLSLNACAAIASARAFCEWIHVVCMQQDGFPFFNKPQTQQDIRAAVKAKIKQSKAAAAKKGWRSELKLEKKAVFDYYEQHKAEFKSLAKAATKIKDANITNYEYSTVYSWLRANVQAKKAETV
jgi:hypothetical protein